MDFLVIFVIIFFSGSGESLNKPAVNSARYVGVPTGSASSDFDVDLDAIAATMQGHSTGNVNVFKKDQFQNFKQRPLSS